jgi:hypothetical protein
LGINEQKGVGGMVQEQGPEFKPQYHQKKKKKRKKECARQKTPLLAAITMLVRVT